MLPVRTFVALTLLTAAVLAASPKGTVRTVTKDGKEYIIARKPSRAAGSTVDPCLQYKKSDDCEQQDECSHIEIGNRFICLRTERVETLYSTLANVWISSPNKAICGAVRDEAACKATTGCEIFESSDSKLCGPARSVKETKGSEETKFTSQDIDDFEITIAENDASARAEVGIEFLGGLEDDVARGRVGGFGGWEIATDAQIYQFLAGTANGGQSNSAGIGLAVSRDEIEIGPEFNREYGTDVSLVLPGLGFSTDNSG